MGKTYNILIATMSMNIGGAETHILELAKGLKDKGFNIIVASSGGVYVDELEQNGISHIKVPMDNKKLHNLIYSFFKLRKIIKDKKIDLVHAHARIPAFILALMNRMARFPFITTVHGTFDTGSGLKYITEWGDMTIAISEDLKYYLLNNYNISPKRISLTVNGINTRKFSPDTDYSDIIEEFDINNKNKHIVTISRLDDQTSDTTLFLIRMMPELVRDLGDIDLIIVGGGTKFAYLKEKADEANKKLGRKAVIMAGSRTDTNKFAALSDLFVGISRSALEAMSCRRPVILAGNSGYMGLFTSDKLKSAMLNNFTCRCTADLDYELLKQGILDFFNNITTAAASEAAEFGQSIIQKYYSVERMVDDNSEVYIKRLEEPETFLTKPKLKKKYDVIILGYYGTRNSGDNAVLKAIVNNLKTACRDIEILALSRNPAETREEYGIDSLGRFKFVKVVKLLRNSKVFMYGGGSLIQDLSSNRSILYYLGMIFLAKKLKTKVMLYANGIGPIYRKINRTITNKIVNQADVISVRDQLARNELTLLGIDKPEIYITADPVLSIKDLEHFDVDRLKYVEKISGNGPYIGVSVTRLKRYPQIEDEMIALCDYISNKVGGTLIFIPMYFSKDMPVIERIRKKMKASSFVLQNRYSPEELLSITGDFDFIIGMRLHSLIYAASRTVPMLGISYDPKIKGFLDSIHQKCIYEITEMNSQKLIEAFDNGWKRREAAVSEIKVHTSELMKKAEIDINIVMKLIGKDR